MARQFEKSVSDESEPQEESGEDEEIALDDDDVESVDQDVVPKRKVQVDNKVRRLPPFTGQPVLFYLMGRLHSNAYGTPSN